MECSCGLVFVSPAPSSEDLRRIYQGGGQFGEGTVHRAEEHERVALRYLQHSLSSLIVHLGCDDEPLRVLEIGAGLSWMARVAKQLDRPSVTVAQDISAEVVDECPWVDHYVVADLDDRRFDGLAPFHVVSMTHVIEHLLDPIATMVRAAQLMSSNGCLFVTAPHRPPGWHPGGSVEPWVGWSYNHTPGHLQYFDRASMARAAQEAGLALAAWNDEHEDGQAFEAWLEPVGAAARRRPAGRPRRIVRGVRRRLATVRRA